MYTRPTFLKMKSKIRTASCVPSLMEAINITINQYLAALHFAYFLQILKMSGTEKSSILILNIQNRLNQIKGSSSVPDVYYPF